MVSPRKPISEGFILCCIVEFLDFSAIAPQIDDIEGEQKERHRLSATLFLLVFYANYALILLLFYMLCRQP